MNYFIQICIALKYIHERKILHRDLKLSNIFVTESNCAKIGDFGISKILEHTQDMALTRAGAPLYMAPEVCESKPYTLKADIWSLGVILYELCSLNVLNLFFCKLNSILMKLIIFFLWHIKLLDANMSLFLNFIQKNSKD